MYKALRTLKINSNMVYQGDMLPENASEFIDVEAFLTKGWIEKTGKKTKANNKVSIADAMSKNVTTAGKNKKKTKRKIGSILAAKSKEVTTDSNLEAATIPKPDMD